MKNAKPPEIQITYIDSRKAARELINLKIVNGALV